MAQLRHPTHHWSLHHWSLHRTQLWTRRASRRPELAVLMLLALATLLFLVALTTSWYDAGR